MPMVTRGHDGRRMVIAAADPAARSLGLYAGMPLAHAQAMVPDLMVMDAAPAEDAGALARLAAWCLRLSPMTAPDAPDGVWIDASGCAHLHGGERPMLALLAGQLSRHRLSGRLAIADTPGAAHAMARFSNEAITVVEPGCQEQALAPLPVEALRLEAGTVDGLRRLGLERIGQLADAPRGPLARRFGDAPLTRLDQAMGRAREPIRPVLPPETIMVRRSFVEPIATAEAFATVILTLVGEACAQLEQRGEGARRLDLVFERVDATMQVVRIGTARPVRDVRHLARLLDERIETVDPGLGVEAMRLVLPSVEPLAYVQRAPFHKVADLAPDATATVDLSELIDRLVNRLGSGNVYRLQQVQSDVPERSQQPVPAQALMENLSAPVVSAWPRPVRLLDPPEPVEAMAMMPDHPPRAFTWRRVRHRIARADGPERIHGEWWQHACEVAAVRDYWIVENQHGRRFWLFRQGDGVDPATGQLAWFLHGLF